MIITQVAWVTYDDTQNIVAIGWDSEQELTRLIARSPKFGPLYTWFNQWAIERFWYSCVIVSYLRSWFTIWNYTGNTFTNIMYDLCDEFERQWIWNPKAGWAVDSIWNAFVTYMNNRFPDKKVWKTKMLYGSSAMGGCLKRNIPIVTAYLVWPTYTSAMWDWEITEKEASSIKKGAFGHCISFVWLWPLWSYLQVQDNYEGRTANQYKIFWFKILRQRTWYQNCYYAILPENIKPTAIKDRSSISNG
jgi:hypothetical protein